MNAVFFLLGQEYFVLLLVVGRGLSAVHSLSGILL